MPTWPAGLPCGFIADSTTYDPFETSTVVAVEVGSPLSRNRYTGEVSDVVGVVRLKGLAQRTLLYTFWRDDCVKGTMPFDGLRDPVTNELVNYLFMARPSFQRRSGIHWRATLTLRRVPT